MAKMEPTLCLKQEAEDIGYVGKEVLDYVKEQQKLDREERAAWRDAQKRQVEIPVAELQAEEKKRTDEVKIQMGQIAVDKELKIKEMELQAQQAQTTTSSALQSLQPHVIKMPSPLSYHPLQTRRMN